MQERNLKKLHLESCKGQTVATNFQDLSRWTYFLPQIKITNHIDTEYHTTTKHQSYKV